MILTRLIKDILRGSGPLDPPGADREDADAVRLGADGGANDESVEFISATRLSEADFWNRSALGQSLRRLRRDNRVLSTIAFENGRGLPEVYNESLTDGRGDIVAFIHDDVWIDDYHIADRIIEGLQSFDVIGVAGNRRRVPSQPSWVFVDERFTPDEQVHLSGAVAHGEHPFGEVSPFGPTRVSCELLDGLFLATRRSALLANGIRFDPSFKFHFYDIDFCRTARQHNLQLGTWPICLTHQSGGAFGSPEWKLQYSAYLQKWRD